MSRANSPPPIPAAPTRSVRSRCTCPDARERMTRRHLDQRGAHRRAAAGDRRAAALFPRPRHRRGGVPGGLPARAEELAAQRAAARSDIVADPGRPQRRARRGAPARAAGSAAAGRDDLRPRRRGDAAGRAARRLALPRRRAAPAVHLLPSGAAGDAADRAGAAHRLGADRRADRARVPGRARRRWSSASRAPRRRIARADVPFETPGAVERAERLAAVAAMIYLVFNEGYSAARRFGPRAAVRRGDPPGAPAAAPVPDRAGDHGPRSR